MPTAVDIGSLIAKSPELRGGRPRIAGTGVMVRTIAVWHECHGMTPEEIAAGYSHLNLAQVYAALAYYYANRDEIDTDLAAEEALFDSLEADSKRR